jgi:anti-anti-sigma regulatory factor
VADGSAERLAGELAGIPGCAAALEHGALLVVPSARVYDLSAPIDAAAQLRVYAGVVAQAVADGFRGLRVAADITPLVTDPARRPAHLHWEQVADRYMTAHPLAPLCLYDTRRIACIDAIRCAHPLQGPGPVRLALHGTGVAAASLAGDVDATLSHVFGDLLAQLPGTDETLDLSQVSFMDGRSAWILHSELVRRRQAGQRLTVTGAPQVLRRLWGICGFDTSFLAA